MCPFYLWILLLALKRSLSRKRPETRDMRHISYQMAAFHTLHRPPHILGDPERCRWTIGPRPNKVSSTKHCCDIGVGLRQGLQPLQISDAFEITCNATPERWIGFLFRRLTQSGKGSIWKLLPDRPCRIDERCLRKTII